MASKSTTADETLLTWEYVDPSDYKIPAEPVTHTARRGLALFRRLLQRHPTEPEAPFKAINALRMPAPWQLERIAPAPDWSIAVDTLEAALAGWLDRSPPDPPVYLLVGPPFSGHSCILTAWAERRCWKLVPPPLPQQILAGEVSWLFEQCNPGETWVLPQLEKTFFRYTDGLETIRRFLDRAYAGDLGRGIIGCDSWAWIFLRRVWQGRLVTPLSLQACDRSRLARIFQSLTEQTDQRRLLFRQSNNGNYVLPPPKAIDNGENHSNFLQFLAAHSRGILGVAHAIWCTGLRTEPDTELAEEAGAEQRRFADQTIWVTAWDQLALPTAPASAGFAEPLMLHALLIHNGLAIDMLRQLLPLSPDQIVETLHRLEQAGLVASAEQCWRITATGYPAAREFLKTRDFPLDQF